MRIQLVGAVLLSALMLAACGGPEGTWRAQQGGSTFEFLKDGTVISDGISGHWKKAGGMRYTLTFTMYGTQATFIAQRVGPDLSIDINGRTSCLKRYTEGAVTTTTKVSSPFGTGPKGCG